MEDTNEKSPEREEVKKEGALPEKPKPKPRRRQKQEQGRRFPYVTADEVIFAIVVLFVFGLTAVMMYAETYDDLVKKDQGVKQGESVYGGNAYIAALKIESTWKVYNTYLSHESEVITKATQYRASYYQAAAEGNAKKSVEAAIAFNNLAINEAYPQLVSEPLARKTMTELNQSISDLQGSLNKWINQTAEYNTARNSFFPRIVGDYGGFVKEYPYYKSDNVKLNISEIMKST